MAWATRIANGSAAAQQELVTIGQPPCAAELIASDSAGTLIFRDANNREFSVPLDQLVRWGSPAVSRAPDEVRLKDGSQLSLASAWDDEPVLAWDGNCCRVQTRLLGAVSLQRGQVSAVLYQLPPDEATRSERTESLLAALGQRPGKDTLLLDNGDVASGSLVHVGRVNSAATPTAGETTDTATLELPQDAGTISMPLSRLRGFALSQVGSPSPNGGADEPPRLVVGLRDGSRLVAESVVADESQFIVRTVQAGELRGADRHDIAYLQASGKRVVYLSNLDTAGFRHEPYLDLGWPYGRDRTARGGPLTVGGRQYAKGLGMHSAARLTYALDGRFSRFAAAVAIDDSAEQRGSVVFRVFVRRQDKQEEAFASPVLRGGDQPEQVVVDLTGASELSLVVDYADRGDERDDADWLDARMESP